MVVLVYIYLFAFSFSKIPLDSVFNETLKHELSDGHLLLINFRTHPHST